MPSRAMVLLGVVLLAAGLVAISQPSATEHSFSSKRAARTRTSPRQPAKPAAETEAAAQARLAAEAERWVERTLRGMSLEEKLGQLLMVDYFGGFLSAESDDYRDLIEQVEKKHVGGYVVRTRGSPLGTQLSQVYPTAVLANQLQRKAEVPLLVAADFERGTAMRLSEGTGFPYAMGVAATGSPKDAYTMGKITALEARAMGVHWNFAPVADVNINPANPIINTRSFGEDPQRVADYVAGFVRGTEEHGVLSTTKHFPGHGDTSVDSHVDLATVGGDRQRLEQVELVPFRAAIAAGTSTIMTGHLAVPAFEPDKEVPATLSPKILTALLRQELGFDGIIVTDALSMGGVTTRYAPGEVAVLSILAGADVLLVPPVHDAALLALRMAVASGRLNESRIDASVRRVLQAKAKLGLHRKREVELDTLNRAFGKPEFREAAEDIANRGVTLLRDQQRLLPLDATKPLRALLVAIAGDPDPVPGAELEREIRWRVDSLQVVRCDTRWTRAETVKLPPADSYDVAVAALFVRVADRKNTVGLPADQAALVHQLLSAGKPVVVVGFGSPYLMERFPQARTWLGSFSTFEVNQRAVGRTLFGQVEIAGQLPVSVPGAARLGDGLRVAANPMTLAPAPQEMVEKLKPAFSLAERALVDGAVTGFQVAVGHRGALTVYAAGRRESARPHLVENLSLATAMAIAVEQGQVLLTVPATRYFPEGLDGAQSSAVASATVRDLLLAAFGATPATPEGTGARKRAEELVLRATGEAAVTMLERRVFSPLKVTSAEGLDVERTAILAQMMLNGGIYGHRRILRRQTVELFTSRQQVGNTVRALGWEVGPWNAGPLSRRAYGADDPETGASLWIDPEKELFIILLPTGVREESREKVRALRDELHRAVVDSLGLAQAPSAR